MRMGAVSAFLSRWASVRTTGLGRQCVVAGYFCFSKERRKRDSGPVMRAVVIAVDPVERE